MENVAMQRARDLDPSARQWVQRLLGRTLGEDEQVTVLAFAPHAAPSSAQPQEAADRVRKALDDIAEQTHNVPEPEIDAAVDEALGHTRQWKS